MTDFIKKKEKIKAGERHQQFNFFTRWSYKIGGIIINLILKGLSIIINIFKNNEGGKQKMATEEKRNKLLFKIISEDCLWGKYTYVKNPANFCKATNQRCVRANCAPFQMAQFFNRPEIKGDK